jgi:hypothetical protein
MSKCISAKGEFSEHELDAKFTCVDCFAFDEDAALDRIESLQAELAQSRSREVDALRRIWQAFGCAFNPDDFKPTVRDVMWGQAEGFAQEANDEDRRIARENVSLQTELTTARAVIEQVRTYVIKLSDAPEHPLEAYHREMLLELLDAAPSSALDARDAEKQAEEVERCANDIEIRRRVAVTAEGNVLRVLRESETEIARAWLRARAAVLRDTEGKSE